jgi:2-hydroxy-3-keto-5-methylthiopentenyl-1-phosphate phosphatase
MTILFIVVSSGLSRHSKSILQSPAHSERFGCAIEIMSNEDDVPEVQSSGHEQWDA